MKNMWISGLGAALLLASCAGTIENVTLPNGQQGKELTMTPSDVEGNYISELYVIKKAGMFTYPKMKTSASSADVYVQIYRFDLHNRGVVVHPFTINDIRPISCSSKKSKGRFTRECKFNKNSLYASYKRHGELIVDESRNGKKSPSVECLKKNPQLKGLSIEGFKKQAVMNHCLERAYEIPHQMGSVSLRLGRRELAATNKHYQIDVENKDIFKNFLYGK